MAAYIDEPFEIHKDSKSHMGVAIFRGGALVYAALRKQKCMTKSPMECELVALMDNVGFIELFEEFFSFFAKYSGVDTDYVSELYFSNKFGDERGRRSVNKAHES